MLRQSVHKYRLQAGITVLLAGLLILFAVFNPQTFLSGRIYLSFFSTIPFIGILALGLTFLIIAGEMDLSFPSLMAMSGLVFADVYLQTSSPWLGFAAALAIGGLGGLLNGLIVVKIGVPSIIATIGTQFFWRGLSSLLAAGLARNIATVRETGFHHLMVGRLAEIPAQVLWYVIFAILLALLLNRHVFGERVLFVGDDIRAARLNGINTDQVRIWLFVMMGLISAFVSVLVCLEMGNWWPTQGEGYMLLVFAAVFIGGTSVFGGLGTVYGSFVGAIIIGIIEAGIISAGFSGFWTRLVHGFVIVASVSVYAIIFRTGR
jgi:simple sugar transport system permease protein